MKIKIFIRQIESGRTLKMFGRTLEILGRTLEILGRTQKIPGRTMKTFYDLKLNTFTIQTSLVRIEPDHRKFMKIKIFGCPKNADPEVVDLRKHVLERVQVPKRSKIQLSGQKNNF